MTAIVSAVIFLGVVGILIPIAAWMSKKALDQGLRVERLDFYLETVAVQTILVALSLWAARSNDLDLTVTASGGLFALYASAGLTVLALVGLAVGWRFSSPHRRERLVQIVPLTRNEKFAWSGVSLTAGVAEEVIYRGVLFGLILTWTDQFWVAATIACMIFAFAHLVQGWAAVGIVFVYGLLFQLLYTSTGSLLAPIIVHVIYDLLAGLLISRWSLRNNEESL